MAIEALSLSLLSSSKINLSPNPNLRVFCLLFPFHISTKSMGKIIEVLKVCVPKMSRIILIYLFSFSFWNYKWEWEESSHLFFLMHSNWNLIILVFFFNMWTILMSKKSFVKICIKNWRTIRGYIRLVFQ